MPLTCICSELLILRRVGLLCSSKQVMGVGSSDTITQDAAAAKDDTATDAAMPASQAARARLSRRGV